MKKNSIEILDVDKYHRRESTEEVQDIIERMPTNFGSRIAMIVAFVFSILLVFGLIIRYPDVVKGNVIINSPLSPIKLVANTSGKIKLNNSVSLKDVKAGDIIAYIKNSTSPDTLQKIKDMLVTYNPTRLDLKILKTLPPKVSLGELTIKYYSFYSNVYQMANFINNKLYDKQIESLRNLYRFQGKQVNASTERIDNAKGSLEYVEKFLRRDSILFAKKVTSEAEFDKTRMEYLNFKNGISNAQSEQIAAGKEAQATLSRIKELEIQKDERRKELEIGILASYNELFESIVTWEQKYLIRSPFDGKVQFLRFWTNDQYVQVQQPLFTIIPKTQNPYGQVFLKAAGAGKVKLGQEVIVKLDDFPYNEYGSIKGVVNSISLTTNTEQTQQGNVEAYLITLKFPKGLRTNYDQLIPFRHEIKGDAEIITNDRKLIERLIGKIKYAVKK